MKTLNIMSAIALIGMFFFTGCEKEETTPVGNEHYSENSKPKLNISNNKKATSGKYMNIDAGPAQNPCVDGNSNCIGPIIIEANAVLGLSEAIDQGNASTYLSQSVINSLSNGDQEAYDRLEEVANGNKKIIEVFLPNAEDERKGFLIGEFGETLSPTNSDLGLIYDL